MKVTNNHNLPLAIYNACARPYPKKEGRLSVTDLINGALVRELTIKHWDELQEDASNRLWAVMGQIGHTILESNAPSNSFVETKLEIKYGDKWTIVGVTDLYQRGRVDDYKWTSVYSFLYGLKPEWVKQMNVYAWQWREEGLPVNELNIIACLRDWQQSKARTETDYPQIPFQVVKVPLWDYAEQTRYIFNRVELFNKPAECCTDEERWKKDDVYAVKKKGNKTARGGKLCKGQLEADGFIESHPDQKWEIEFREGGYTKCEGYCSVSKFCPYMNEGKNASIPSST